MTGTELRTLRQAAGLTQEATARLLTYSLRHYVRWERGVSPIPTRWAEAIRAKLGAKEKCPLPLDKGATA